MGRLRSASAPYRDSSSHAGEWDASRVRALRQFLRLTQKEFSRRLGARQQTISEWEVGRHRPRGMSVLMLSQLAREVGFEPKKA